LCKATFPLYINNNYKNNAKENKDIKT
jgi:hypothetical protein